MDGGVPEVGERGGAFRVPYGRWRHRLLFRASAKPEGVIGNMGNKTMRFELRLTAKEKEILKRKAKKYGMTPSELVRHALIHSDDLSINVIDIAPLRKMVFEIHKHGVNLNQMMRFLNTYGLDAFDESQVIPVLESERTVFTEAKAALLSLEEAARAKKVIVSFEMPEDDESESEDS